MALQRDPNLPDLTEVPSSQSAPVPSLPPKMRALVLDAIGTAPTVREVPTPQATAGSVIVQILAAAVLPYAADVYITDVRKYPMPVPLIIGSSAVGRVAAVGPDSVKLVEGQLVLLDSYVRARDDKEISFLPGLHQGYSAGSMKLMQGEWRDWSYAEYCKCPLENCYALNEQRFLGSPSSGGLGYALGDLVYMARLTVPHGGWVDIGLKAGETVIVAPATGSFGGAAVEVAVAMGAKVIVAGRTLSSLQAIADRYPGRVYPCQMTGDVQEDAAALRALGPVQAYQDWSPPIPGAQATHVKSCIAALSRGGRISLMGGIRDDITINYSAIMHSNLTIKGKWMYEPEDPKGLIRLVEVGLLKIGKEAGLKNLGSFGLDRWDEAFKTVAGTGYGVQVLITPNEKK